MVYIIVLNCQQCNQCLKCQVSGHKNCHKKLSSKIVFFFSKNSADHPLVWWKAF